MTTLPLRRRSSIQPDERQMQRLRSHALSHFFLRQFRYSTRPERWMHTAAKTFRKLSRCTPPSPAVLTHTALSGTAALGCRLVSPEPGRSACCVFSTINCGLSLCFSLSSFSPSQRSTLISSSAWLGEMSSQNPTFRSAYCSDEGSKGLPSATVRSVTRSPESHLRLPVFSGFESNNNLYSSFRDRDGSPSSPTSRARVRRAPQAGGHKCALWAALN